MIFLAYILFIVVHGQNSCCPTLISFYSETYSCSCVNHNTANAIHHHRLFLCMLYLLLIAAKDKYMDFVFRWNENDVLHFLLGRIEFLGRGTHAICSIKIRLDAQFFLLERWAGQQLFYVVFRIKCFIWLIHLFKDTAVIT